MRDVKRGLTMKHIAAALGISVGQVSKIFSRLAIAEEMSVPKRIWGAHRKLRGGSAFDIKGIRMTGMPVDKWTAIQKAAIKRKRRKAYMKPGPERDGAILRMKAGGKSAAAIAESIGVDRQVVYRTLRRLT